MEGEIPATTVKRFVKKSKSHAVSGLKYKT